MGLSEVKEAELEIDEEEEIQDQDKDKISSSLLTAFLHWLKQHTKGMEMLLSDDNLTRLFYNLHAKGEVNVTIVLPNGPGYSFNIQADDNFRRMCGFFMFMNDIQDAFDELIDKAKNLQINIQEGSEELKKMSSELRQKQEEIIRGVERLQKDVDNVEKLLSPLEEIFGRPLQEEEVKGRWYPEVRRPEEPTGEPKVSFEVKDEISRKIERLEQEKNFFHKMIDKAKGFLDKVWSNIKNFFRRGPRL